MVDKATPRQKPSRDKTKPPFPLPYLVPHKVDVRALAQHEGVRVAEGIAGQGVGRGRGQVPPLQRALQQPQRRLRGCLFVFLCVCVGGLVGRWVDVCVCVCGGGLFVLGLVDGWMCVCGGGVVGAIASYLCMS